MKLTILLLILAFGYTEFAIAQHEKEHRIAAINDKAEQKHKSIRCKTLAHTAKVANKIDPKHEYRTTNYVNDRLFLECGL